MIWQDLIFLAGSVFSLVVLGPTVAKSDANVPLATSAPSALIALVYGVSFATLGMPFSAAGAVATGLMWSVIGLLRSPNPLQDVGSQDGQADEHARTGGRPAD